MQRKQYKSSWYYKTKGTQKEEKKEGNKGKKCGKAKNSATLPSLFCHQAEQQTNPAQSVPNKISSAEAGDATSAEKVSAKSPVPRSDTVQTISSDGFVEGVGGIQGSESGSFL